MSSLTQSPQEGVEETLSTTNSKAVISEEARCDK